MSRSKLAGVAGIVLLVLAACVLMGPPSTPAPPATESPVPFETPNLPAGGACPANVYLTHGSEVHLRANARMAVVRLADSGAAATGHEVMLSLGELVINSVLPAERSVQVTSPSGFIARLTGRTMIVAYEGEGGQFTLACVDGACQLGPDAERLTALTAGSQGTLTNEGSFLGPFAISLDGLPPGCTTLFEATPIPSATATPTPPVDFAATATAACEEFHEQYPLTPTCP